MDVFARLCAPSPDSLVCVGLHTCGEPTRIVVRGMAHLLQGNRLLDKRDHARRAHDHLRKRVMLEPRGHKEMYGAVLVSETELTRTGEADIGVLFLHGEGYSTMCGHATIALGRFLVDTDDVETFPSRHKLTHDATTRTTRINLHAPCGLVRVDVPTLLSPSNRITYDPTRLVSFLSVPCFATALDLEVEVDEPYRWPELGERRQVKVDVAFGGAFYAILSAKELGFSSGLRGVSLSSLSHATARLKALLVARYPSVTHHPTEPSLSYLYGVVVSDTELADDETGLCFFADQQLDRSPTGSAVGARIALAHTRLALALHTPKRFHSLVSLSSGEPDRDAFVGEAVEEVDIHGGEGCASRGVVVKTSGRAFYTDAAVFVAEADDALSRAGFVVDLPSP